MLIWCCLLGINLTDVACLGPAGIIIGLLVEALFWERRDHGCTNSTPAS